MIIGKSLTALGGGGLKPEIIVTAKAGALLNLHFKGSSIILQTYQLGAEETQHTFAVDVSETAYIVDDTTNGSSAEVLVDAVTQYSVEIEYVLWLYRDGKTYENITGKWTTSGVGTKTRITLDDNYMSFTMTDYASGQQSQHSGNISTSNAFDISKYSVMKLTGSSFNGQTSSGPRCLVSIWDTVSSSAKTGDFTKKGTQDTFEISMNVSGVVLGGFTISTYYASFKVNRIWFE